MNTVHYNMKYVIALPYDVTTTKVCLLFACRSQRGKRYDSNLCSYASDRSVVITCFRVSVSAAHAKQHLVTFM